MDPSFPCDFPVGNSECQMWVLVVWKRAAIFRCGIGPGLFNFFWRPSPDFPDFRRMGGLGGLRRPGTANWAEGGAISGWMDALLPDRRHQRADADDVHDPGQVEVNTRPARPRRQRPRHALPLYPRLAPRSARLTPASLQSTPPSFQNQRARARGPARRSAAGSLASPLLASGWPPRSRRRRDESAFQCAP